MNKYINNVHSNLNIYARGFTLIELLVVVAIIGILSGIILASLGSARTSAYDAKVKAQLFNIRSAAEIYYTTNFNYGAATNSCGSGMFTDGPSGLSKLSVSVNYPTTENTIICNSNGTAYAVSDNLSGANKYWCVDSTSASKQEANALGVATACQ